MYFLILQTFFDFFSLTFFLQISNIYGIPKMPFRIIHQRLFLSQAFVLGLIRNLVID
jgi:hypothetical protein